MMGGGRPCEKHSYCTYCKQHIPPGVAIYTNWSRSGSPLYACAACFKKLSQQIELSEEEMCSKDFSKPQEYTTFRASQ